MGMSSRVDGRPSKMPSPYQLLARLRLNAVSEGWAEGLGICLAPGQAPFSEHRVNFLS